MIFPEGKSCSSIIFAIPLRHECISADGEFIQLRLLLQNADKFTGLVINAQG